jgi:hypothetical protein
MNLHDRLFVGDLLRIAVERFNTSTDRETLLCPRANDIMKSQADWPAASERAIAHRLAFYLEHVLIHEFRLPPGAKISVDCEYNRHGRAAKTHAISKELVGIVLAAKRKAVRAEKISRRKAQLELRDQNPDDLEIDSPEFVLSIAPDIVVHRRLTDDENLLVIELKKETNKEDPRYDDLKLKQFTHPHDYHYELGAAVIAMDNVAGNRRFLRIAAIYEDGGKVWSNEIQASA